MNDEPTWQPLAGPLGNRIKLYSKKERRSTTYELRVNTNHDENPDEPADRAGKHANALTMLRRLGPLDNSDRKNVAKEAHRWAAESSLGLGDNKLLKSVKSRRQALLDRWPGSKLRSTMRIEWRLATGLGLQYGVIDNGIALHGTFGWPIIPASTVKGVARAGSHGSTDAEVNRLLGHPGHKGSAGTVIFLDALPGDITVHQDVITPHQQPYYAATGDKNGHTDPIAPGEHHNPIPLPFLSLSGTMMIDLIGGEEADFNHIIDWLNNAGENIGIGGRVTAGYGYFTVEKG